MEALSGFCYDIIVSLHRFMFPGRETIGVWFRHYVINGLSHR